VAHGPLGAADKPGDLADRHRLAEGVIRLRVMLRAVLPEGFLLKLECFRMVRAVRET
jgi:hypothetical protein